VNNERPDLASSRIAVVEVTRAVKILRPELLTAARSLLASCLLVELNTSVIEAATRFASAQLRTLDALHLATAVEIGAERVLAYDRRLLEASANAGFDVVSPGR